MKMNKIACLGLAAIVALGAMGCGSDKKSGKIVVAGSSDYAYYGGGAVRCSGQLS